jgi:ribosome silencing factor RsfS/YbeB/iojap
VGRAAEKKATDVMALDVGETLVVTDYFVIATGANDRQVHAIADSVEDALREAGARPIGREGERELTWVLLRSRSRTRPRRLPRKSLRDGRDPPSAADGGTCWCGSGVGRHVRDGA